MNKKHATMKCILNLQRKHGSILLLSSFGEHLEESVADVLLPLFEGRPRDFFAGGGEKSSTT